MNTKTRILALAALPLALVAAESGDAELVRLRALAAKRVAEIRATRSPTAPAAAPKYYLSSASGDDAADGRTPATAWRSVGRLNREELAPGSFVMFERGGLFRGSVAARPGVTYTAYGEGPKPRLYGSPADGADPAKWTRTDAPEVWSYEIGRQDVGTLVFDGGAACAIKVLVRTDRKTGAKTDQRTGLKFESYRDLSADLHFWHDYYKDGTGRVYLRSRTNPGERFRSIEFNVKQNGIRVGRADGVTVDNLDLRYIGAHGVGAGSCRGLTVANCEFAWIGGSIQAESLFGRDFPTRYGNAVEIWGGCEDYTVTNCFIREVYDAGVTHQYSIGEKDGARRFDMRRVRYADNVIERCNYSIEYFLALRKGNESEMQDVVFERNLMFDAGVGFCTQRPDVSQAAHVKAWYNPDRNRAKGFVIRDNAMCMSDVMLLQVCAGPKNSEGRSSLPVLERNVIIGREGGSFGMISDTSNDRLPYDASAQACVDRFGSGNRCLFVTGSTHTESR